MTMEKVGEQPESGEQAEAPEPRYSVDPAAIEALGRSVSLVIGERLCEAALAKLKEPDAWRSMSYKELRKLLRENCSDQEGYLSPQHPLLETVARILLTSKADAVALHDLHDEISDLWMTSPWPRHISIESLQRVLDNGLGYGIVRADEG